MRLLGNILAVDSLPLLSDLSLAARRPKRSKRRRIPVANHIGVVCGFFVIARSGGQNRAGRVPRLRGGASFKIFGLDNLLHHSRGMIDREEVSGCSQFPAKQEQA